MGGVLVGGPIQKIPIQNKYNENGEAFHRFFHRGVDGRSPVSSMDVVISRIRIFVYFRRPVVFPKRLHIYAHIYLCDLRTCIYVWMCLCIPVHKTNFIVTIWRWAGADRHLCGNKGAEPQFFEALAAYFLLKRRNYARVATQMTVSSGSPSYRDNQSCFMYRYTWAHPYINTCTHST